MLVDFFRIGLNNLKRRKLRSWLTMIGIFIGIAAVVSLISLGSGLRTAITGQFASLSTDTLTVQNAETGFGPPGSTAIEKLDEHDLKLISSVRGVKLAIPKQIKTARMEFNKIVLFKTITNIPEDPVVYEWIYESMGAEADEGRLLGRGDKGKIMLGSDFVRTDDFKKTLTAGKKVKIEGEEFEIIGILESSSNFLMNGAIMMLDEDLKEVMEIEDEMDMIVAQLEDANMAEETAERIKKALRNDRGLKEGEEDFSVETPLQAIQTVNTILISINIVVVGIAIISLVVGGIGIANTMYTSVIERTKEIGTMKAVGAKNSDVLSIFLIESGLLGLVGGIIGVLIGLGISYSVSYSANIAFGSEIISFNCPFYLIIFAVSFSFSLGILFGLIPSIQASKLKPAEALRAK